MIAVTRLFCSKSVVRRVTGREQVSHELPPLCFLAGANSIFVGARLLTADIPGRSSDDALVADLKMRPMGRVLRAQHA